MATVQNQPLNPAEFAAMTCHYPRILNLFTIDSLDQVCVANCYVTPILTPLPKIEFSVVGRKLWRVRYASFARIVHVKSFVFRSMSTQQWHTVYVEFCHSYMQIFLKF